MEASWAQRFREIFQRQQSSVVDGKIDNDYHVLLKTRDGRNIDAGELKEKPAGSLVYVTTPGSTPTEEPSIYTSKDGSLWVPAQVEGKLKTVINNNKRLCWTGDRFLLSIGEDRPVTPSLNGVCLGALSNVQLFPTLPASTLRPNVILYPATSTINTEWVVVYAPNLNPITGGYNLEVRYLSCAGDTIQLGPAMTIPGGGWSGLDGGPGLHGLWNDGISVIVGHVFRSWVITSPGSLTTAPTVGPDQGSRGVGFLVAQCSGGVYVWNWSPGGTSVQRRPIDVSTGVIGDVDSDTIPPGFTNLGTIVGPFGGPYLNLWSISPFTNMKCQPVSIDRAANGLVFGANPTSSPVLRTIYSAVYQPRTKPAGSTWLLKAQDRVFHLNDAGEVVSTYITFDTSPFLPWRGNQFVWSQLGGGWALYNSNNDGSMSVESLAACAATQEYTFSRDDFTFGVPAPKRILFASGKRVILAGPVPCVDCIVPGQPGNSIYQSRDGGTWTHHLDKITFDSDDPSLAINAMDSTGTGLVVAIGSHFGPAHNGNVAVSRDFGETWGLLTTPITPGLLTGLYVRSDYEWIIFANNSSAWYTYDGGGHWTQITFPTGWQPTSQAYENGIKYFNGYWWAYGSGSGNAQWDTPLIRSKDLKVWEPVVTPWSGTYPPMATYLGHAHNSNSGNIYTFEHDPSTNTVLATGFSPYRGLPSTNNWPQIMLSTDGGESFVEIGKEMCAYFATDYGWEGIYNLPDTLKFSCATNGAKFAYDNWFILGVYNRAIPIDFDSPPILSLSPDGKTYRAVFTPHQLYTYSLLLGVKGDITN